MRQLRRPCRVPRPGGPQRRAVRRVGRVDRRRAAQDRPRLTTPASGVASLAAGLALSSPARTDRGPATRRSPRRRVIPRASSSASSGQRRSLRVAPGGVAELADGEAAGVGREQVGGDRSGAVDGVARGNSPSRTTTRPRRTSSLQLGTVDVVGWRRREAAARARRASAGCREQRVGALEPGPAAIDHDAVASSPSTARSRSSSRATSRPSEPPSSRRARSASVIARARRRRRPSRRPSVPRRSPVSSSTSDVDPAPLGDHPFDVRSGRPRPTPVSTGCDVEDLAAADRLVATRFAQHVPVAGQQRQAVGQVQPHRTGRAGRRATPAPSTRSRHGVLARADVGEVGAAPRHVVVERRRAPSSEASTRSRQCASVRIDTTASPRSIAPMVDAGEVERDPVRRARCVSTAVPARLDRPAPGPAVPPGSDHDADRRRRRRRRACR